MRCLVLQSRFGRRLRSMASALNARACIAVTDVDPAIMRPSPATVAAVSAGYAIEFGFGKFKFHTMHLSELREFGPFYALIRGRRRLLQPIVDWPRNGYVNHGPNPYGAIPGGYTEAAQTG